MLQKYEPKTYLGLRNFRSGWVGGEKFQTVRGVPNLRVQKALGLKQEKTKNTQIFMIFVTKHKKKL